MNTRDLLDQAIAWKRDADYAAKVAESMEKAELQHRWEDVVADIRLRLNVPAEIVPYANCDKMDKYPMIVEVKLEGFSIFASVNYELGRTIFNSWLSGSFNEDGYVASMTPQENIYMAVLESAKAAGVQ